MAFLRTVRLLFGLLLVVICALATPVMSEPARSTASGFQQLSYLPGLAGDYFFFDSNKVGRGFHIFVRLPESYEHDGATEYPVVYVLDGDSLFPIIAPNHLFLTYDKGVPEAIIVGIAYGSFEPHINLRGYDFSAPAADAEEDQGGAPGFLAFLEKELLPKIDNSYSVDTAKRVLFGQSRGGYMVLYAAFTQPNLFSGYIASNPSFDPGRELFHKVPANSPQLENRSRLMVTSGSNDYPHLRKAALEWDSIWKGRTDLPWVLRFETIDEGTHASYSATSYRMGITWMLDAE